MIFDMSRNFLSETRVPAPKNVHRSDKIRLFIDFCHLFGGTTPYTIAYRQKYLMLSQIFIILEVFPPSFTLSPNYHIISPYIIIKISKDFVLFLGLLCFLDSISL